MEILAKQGLEEFSYPFVADRMRISRQLINAYFPNQSQLFEDICIYIRARFQHYVLQKIEKKTTNEALFKNYIRACFTWIEDHPDFTIVWLLLFYKTNQSKELRRQFNELGFMGQQRITQMLQNVAKNHEKSADFFAKRAKMIQAVITGTTVMLCSEQLPFKNSLLIEETVKTCCDLAGIEWE